MEVDVQKSKDSRVARARIHFSTRGDCEVVNISDALARATARCGLSEGILTVFSPGATGAITTTEFEPGCIADLQAWFAKHVPEDPAYIHHRYHGDGNGHSHLRAALVGPSLNIPFADGEPILGTWQSVVFIDFDNRPHRRELVVHFVGS